MKCSPKHEAGGYVNSYEFDPQVDFSQFLEEARQHARAMDMQKTEARRGESAEAKSKKSWKKYLFEWWKFDAKKGDCRSTKAIDIQSSSHISRPRKKGHVSGPVYGAGGPRETKHRRQTSGLVTSLSNPENNETPYVCLDHTNNAYGPVYLVT